jgi:hypothetical protein
MVCNMGRIGHLKISPMISIWRCGRRFRHGLFQPPQPRATMSAKVADALGDDIEDAHDRPPLPLPELTRLPPFTPPIDIRAVEHRAVRDECASDLPL